MNHLEMIRGQARRMRLNDLLILGELGNQGYAGFVFELWHNGLICPFRQATYYFYSQKSYYRVVAFLRVMLQVR
jgi:hypothetical protein